MDTMIMKLVPEELEKAVGGTFTLNYYWQSEYEEAGIKVVTHFSDKDEVLKHLFGSLYQECLSTITEKGIHHAGSGHNKTM